MGQLSGYHMRMESKNELDELLDQILEDERSDELQHLHEFERD